MTCAFGRNSLISKWDAAEARPSIEQIRDGGFCVNSALFSPIFSRAREKIGSSETTCSCKSARINPSGASRQLPLHKGALVRAQVESLPFQGRWLGEAETERSSQICSNPSVSAAPSQHPYPFCPFGTFPPDRGNRPLEGEPWGCFTARRSRPFCRPCAGSCSRDRMRARRLLCRCSRDMPCRRAAARSFRGWGGRAPPRLRRRQA